MENINGFVVIGKIWINENNCYKCNVICKVCKKEFISNYHALPIMKSCGCARPSKLNSLPAYINGFKTIKCHGYDTAKGVRWATVECKICKRIYEVDPNKLQYRKHCGCMRKGVIVCKYVKSHPQLSQAIKYMMGRCYNKNNQDYYNYGAKGITVCDEWRNDRNKFCEWALENGFEEGKNLSIDRIDSLKGYYPENCRWSTATTQAQNTRRNVLTMELARKIREDANNMTYLSIAKKYKVSYGTVSNVINNRSWKE